MRLFFALSLTENLQRNLEEYMKPLREQSGGSARWQPAKNIHLTLKFLGEVSPTRLQALKKAGQQACLHCPPFTFEVSGLGAFPHLNRPRVLWAGVQAPPELAALQEKLEAACAEAGFPREEKPFRPHLTLGRVREPIGQPSLQALRAALQAAPPLAPVTAPAQALTLYQSALSAEGAQYTLIFSFPFSNEVTSEHA